MSDPVSVHAASTKVEGTPDNLPMIVVNHAATVPRPGMFRRLFRVARFLPLVMALLFTGGLIGLYFQPPGLQKVMSWLQLEPGAGSSNPIAVPAHPKKTLAPPPAPRGVVGLGKLIPRDNVITVALPFGAGDARIAELRVKEGEKVNLGDALAVLDNLGPLNSAVNSARAAVAAREASVQQAKAATSASLDEARSNLQRAEAGLANAASEFSRSEELLRRGFTTRALFDQKRTVRDQAVQDVERARAQLSRFQGTSVEDQPDVKVALAALASAEAELARSERDLDKAYVRAPGSGTILSIFARAGEKPGSNGLLKLGDIDHMTAEIEVYQTDVGKIALGDSVEIKAAALPSVLSGVVARIGLEVGRQSLVDSSPAANTDARVVKVTVTLDPASSLLASRFTNLQVLASFKPSQ